MFKGIHYFIILTALATGVTSSYADSELVSREGQDDVTALMQACESRNGQKLTDNIYENKKINERKDGDDVLITYETCDEVLCYLATAGVSSVNFNSIGDFEAYLEENGINRAAAVVAKDKVCVTETFRTTREREQDQDQGSGKVSGGGGIRIKVDGSWYSCANTSDPRECAKIHGVDRSGRITFEFDGETDDGTRRYVGVARVGDGDLDGRIYLDIDGDVDGRGDGRIYRNGSYMYVNGDRFRCSASESDEACLRRLRKSGRIEIDGDLDCAHCGFRVTTRSSRSSGTAGILQGVAEITGALAPPLFGFLGVRAQANAYRDSNKAWANAAATGFEQCQIMQTSYVQDTYSYISSNEHPDRTVTPPNCNGYQLNSFGGMSGQFGTPYGGYGNGWYGAGYTPGFMAAMYGPGGGFNPYLSVTGGFGSPYAGYGYSPYGGFGVQGNLNLNTLLGLPAGGISFGGGMNTGGYAGYPGYGGGWGGSVGGGWGGSIGGGWGGNPAYSPMACVRAPCPGQGGWGGSVGWGGNAGGGWGGNAGWGWGNNATTAPWGGATAWGGVNYPNNGGSYWGNTGGWGGNNGWGNGNNGWGNNSANGNGWYSVQNAQNSNAQAFQVGGMNQQIALQNQAGQAAYNAASHGGGSGYGYAPYAPGNAGFSLSAGYGLGGSFQYGFQ